MVVECGYGHITVCMALSYLYTLSASAFIEPSLHQLDEIFYGDCMTFQQYTCRLCIELEVNVRIWTMRMKPEESTFLYC